MKLTLLFAALLSSISLFAQTPSRPPEAVSNPDEPMKSVDQQRMEEQRMEEQRMEEQKMEEKAKKNEEIKKQNEALDEQTVIDNSIPSSTPP